MMTFPAARPLTRGLILAGFAAAIAACKGLTAIDPSFQNMTATDTVYAINGAPPNSPNAVKFFDGLVTRADQSFTFDLAFDIDAAGNPVLIPVKALATTFSTSYSIGLQKATGSFESVLEAPKEGYRADTALAVGVGQPVIAETRDVFVACAYALKGQSYFSKIVVTEVDPVLRRMVFTMTVNRNCGFHSFSPGFPPD
jgi:hypothetical protein